MLVHKTYVIYKYDFYISELTFGFKFLLTIKTCISQSDLTYLADF